ncbi:hypothetical protein M4578_14430 [Salipiger sp. P9]|uniref:hypothetical protein n=1 Tax=Salipiger pentaromativorans TaxID=2943193 RepID=UPI0021584E5E|nr:hypothetical protein [Salipiger pentaromativorans]MCR8549032.1 hypothetical protein [Salipiger pentaromativorans]
MRPLFALLLLGAPALADPSKIVAAEAVPQSDGWRISVTLRHPDTGWAHYADGWRIEAEDGTILGTRVLTHPHEAEQPFTRSLSTVAIPQGMARVYIRARCLVDGWSADRNPLDLP